MLSAGNLTSTTETANGRTTVRFAGEIDLATAERLRASLTAMIAAHDGLQVDLSDVSFIDSYGLRVLVAAHGVVPAGEGAFQIVDASRQVRRTFTVTGLDVAYGWPSGR